MIIGWVFFASDNLTSAINYIKAMLGGASFINQGFLYDIRSNFVYLIIGIISALPFGKELYARIPDKAKYAITVVLSVLSFYICTAYLLDSSYNPFLYFRF